jgi:hypothetical protein
MRKGERSFFSPNGLKRGGKKSGKKLTLFLSSSKKKKKQTNCPDLGGIFYSCNYSPPGNVLGSFGQNIS